MNRLMKGDRCIVTGDSASWAHQFDPQTEVVLVEPHKHDPSWRCVPANELAGEDWWVHIQDLEVMIDEPTDEEIRQVFGLDPRVCTACGCTCGGAK